MSTDNDAVIKVGDGRGFIIEAHGQRFVITAAHCLPHFPPCHGASYIEERTYANLLGRLADAAPTVWCECVFVDPIADVAVLGGPDNQKLGEEAEAYEALIEEAPALSIGEAADTDRMNKTDKGRVAQFLSLDGHWIPCRVRAFRGLWIEDAAEAIRGGMSGSPIVDEHGAAIGVVCVSGGTESPDQQTKGGPNPRLTHCLPGWLLLRR
jgi:hypothetical protein